MAQLTFTAESIIEAGTTIYCTASHTERTGDWFVDFFETSEEANEEATYQWNHLTASEKSRTRVWVYALKCTQTTTWENFSEWDEWGVDGAFDSEIETRGEE